MREEEDIRAIAERIRLNFLSGDTIFYDDGLVAWKQAGHYCIQHHHSLYAPRSLFEGIRLVIWLSRAQRTF